MSVVDTIKKCIDENRLCRITYKGKNDSEPKTRVIEPISFGLFSPKNKRYQGKSGGKECVRCWIRANSYSYTFDNGLYKPDDPLTKKAGYRMFLIERIVTAQPLKEKFNVDTIFIQRNRPKINPSKDKDMNPVLNFIKIGESTIKEPEFIFNNLKDILYKALTNYKIKTLFNRELKFDKYKRDTFSSESDYENFRVNARLDVKVRSVYNYIMEKVFKVDKLRKLRPELKTKLEQLLKIITQYFVKNVKKFEPSQELIDKLKEIIYKPQ